MIPQVGYCDALCGTLHLYLYLGQKALFCP